MSQSTWRRFQTRPSSLSPQYQLEPVPGIRRIRITICWAGETWLTSADLKGQWSAAKVLPTGMDIVGKDQYFSAIKEFIPMQPAKPDAIVPEVFYSTVPAEMILFDGQPAYKAIPGTQLSYANNTMSYVFLFAKTNEVYYLTQGRWFSAKSLNGPWTFRHTQSA